jgi:hypothetical protein
MFLFLDVQPDIYFGDLRIAEPVITLTGLVIGAVAWYAWMRLGRISNPLPEQRMVRIFFGYMSASAVVGAFIGHAFLYHFPFYFKLPGWVLSMVAASALERSAIFRIDGWVGEKTNRLLLSLNIFKWFVFVGIVGVTVYYPVVQIHMAICMLLGLGVAEFLLWKRDKDDASRLMLLSIVPALVAALIGVFKLSPSIWFAHQDVSHMFICVSLWLLMLGTESMLAQEPVNVVAGS